MDMRLAAIFAILLSACAPPPELADVVRADAVRSDTQISDVSDVQGADVRDVSRADVADAQVSDVACSDGGIACSGSCVDLSRDEENCGGCGVVCSATGAHQSAICGTRSSGAIECLRTCSGGYGDCSVGSNGNGNDEDGCESALNTPEHCGSCANHCYGATPRCVGRICQS